MAFAVPLLLILVMGMLVCGRYLFTAHATQQAANDATRAAIAGIDKDERRMLAARTAGTSLRGSALDPSRSKVEIGEADGAITVSIRYDLSSDPMMALPFSPAIVREVRVQSSTLLGGL